ncbi:MAG TPA: ABC transporter ATP-binding protein [Thermoanaerobaculia bacterium]
MSSTAIEARDLAKSYGGPPLFVRLSLRAESGLTAVAGRNGSGKTTLLKILAGLLRPDEGTVRVERAGARLSGEPLRLAVGWAGQDLNLYEDLTALENLTFFRRAAGAHADRGEIGRRLEEVDLAYAADQRVGGFSTGMKQRLRVAFATLFDPPILLLDEPMAGLDVSGRELVARLIAARRRNGAVFLASNDERDFVQPDQTLSLGR